MQLDGKGLATTCIAIGAIVRSWSFGGLEFLIVAKLPLLSKLIDTVPGVLGVLKTKPANVVSTVLE